MVEKKKHEVTVWAGNERAFRLVAHFQYKKGSWFWREAAGYSTVILPEGTGRWPHLSDPSWYSRVCKQFASNNLEKV